MKMSEVKYLFLWGVRKAKVTILCTLYFFKITMLDLEIWENKTLLSS